MRSALHAGAGLYSAAMRARSAAYEAGLLPVRRVPGLAVVSVGGLAVGGDGKTPMAIHLASRLRRSGRAVAVVSRGYRGSWERAGGVVSKGGALLASAAEAGDEAVLCARRLPGVAVVVGADRVRAAERARALGADVAVLDSGFQHRRLGRDLDILCLCPTRLDGDRVLPAGPLREPPEAAARADLLAFLSEADEDPRTSRGCSFRLVTESLVDPDLEPRGIPEELAGRRVFVLAGIARPERVLRTVGRLGAHVVGSMLMGDHFAYRASDREQVAARARRAGAELVVTTEKDMVRLGGALSIEVVAIRVDVSVEAGESALAHALDQAVPAPNLHRPSS